MVIEEGIKEGGNKESDQDYIERQLVVFNLGEEEFGVDINEVNSIIKMTSITRIPNSQDFIEGVINLRGRIIVVIDLAKKIGLPSREKDKNTRIIVIETKETMIGMIVDHSREAIRISQDKIQPPPAIITNKIKSDYLEGVVVLKERLLILLDLAKVLGSGDMAGVQKSMSQGGSMTRQGEQVESGKELSESTSPKNGSKGL